MVAGIVYSHVSLALSLLIDDSLSIIMSCISTEAFRGRMSMQCCSVLQKCGGVCTQQCYMLCCTVTCVMRTPLMEAVCTERVATHAVSCRTPDSSNSQCVADYNSNSVGYKDSPSILLEYNLI